MPTPRNALLSLLLIATGLSACSGPGSDHSPDSEWGTVNDTPRDRRIVGPERFAQPPMPPPSDIRTADGRPGPAYWQNRADYAIEATLDEQARSVSGRATIRYVNNSPLPLAHLWINLEQNLYRPDSSGALITKPTQRFGAMSFSGGIDVGPVRVDGRETPLTVYGTLARLDLPTPLGPQGRQAEIELTWSFQVPEHGSDRMGTLDTPDGVVFQVAQWFPQIARYDDVRGWHTLEYLGQGEFATDIGDFDVQLTVPRSHIVAATGELTNADEVLTSQQTERLSAARASTEPITIRSTAEINDPSSRPAGNGPLTWKFRARSVRTFAWSSSPAFAWDACAATGTGPDGASVGDLGSSPGSVLCQAFYPREAAGLWGPPGQGGGAAAILRWCVEHYSSCWFAYPYGAASTVQGTVGGMEYPGLIFCSERQDARGLFGVTSHEIGHTWFPMIVNSDERRHAWMDEGFNSLINFIAAHARFGDPAGDPRDSHNPRPTVFAARNPRGLAQPVDTPADLIAPGDLGTLQYRKTACGLLVLRHAVLGPERFDAAFREYIRRWAFKRPEPADFYRTIEDVAGMDLGWFWRGWFHTGGADGAVDQSVTTIMQPEGESRHARVTFRSAGMVMPVNYRVEYTDGTREDRRLPVQAWGSADEFQAAFDTRGRRVRRITIDPDGWMPDVNRRNNVAQ